MKHNFKVFVFAALLAALAGCMTDDPVIAAGREWNPGSRLVADTTSEFDMTDQMLVQLRYGKGFDFNKLKVTFYEGTLGHRGVEIWSHEVMVSEKMDSYTLQGKAKNGKPITAREMCKQKQAGPIVIEFSTEGRVIAQKQIYLIRTR
ncbi:MAG: hypothetical protein HUK20_04280 [Fibrobacter sp.]|nr:hypothetical protein [Fibrobacter sp.]